MYFHLEENLISINLKKLSLGGGGKVFELSYAQILKNFFSELLNWHYRYDHIYLPNFC